jgi:arylsulfatase A-like enzyme
MVIATLCSYLYAAARRYGIVLPLLVTLLVVGNCATFALGEEPPARPNVVLLLADDISYTDHGFMGHEAIQTPSLDQLARESSVFTRGYVPTSLCRASLMTMATGLYAHQHLVTGNDPVQGTPREAMLKHIDRLPTIAKLLQNEGYACLQTGKWWEGNYQRGGFTHGMTHGDPQRGGRHGDEGLQIGRTGIEPIREFLNEHGDQPFFIWYAPMLPHQPHNPPERLLAKYRDKAPSLHVAKYWAMVQWWDETCGEVLNELKKRDLDRNTLVVYVADNGWIQDPAKPVFDERSKRSRFDMGLRTPVMFRWPSKIESFRDETTLVSSIDLAPTILSACGIEPTPEMQGVNLLPVARQKESLERDTVFGEIFDHDQPEVDRASPGLQHRWCLHDRWKLIVSADEEQTELYDVLADPTETKNLAQQHPERVAALRKRLDAWWKP